MLIWQGVLVAGVFGILSCTGTASANSCGNVDVIGTFDASGLSETESEIYAAGTFRVAGEEDEAKQPFFNLSEIVCNKQADDSGRVSVECKVTQAVLFAKEGKPDADNPNCSLDLTSATYTMAELQKGVLTGMEAISSTTCYNATLTIDRNARRIYLSFVRSQYADNYDKIQSGICGAARRTQVLMNCTAWPKLRKRNQQTPPRYCDFSSASDK